MKILFRFGFDLLTKLAVMLLLLIGAVLVAGHTRQWVVIDNLAYWPSSVKETSALAVNDGKLWTLNDGGNKNILYAFSAENYQPLGEVEVEGHNRDWESLAQDKKYLYIGDCGNNSALYRKFQIYKVRWSDLNKLPEKVKAQPMYFEYKDQPEKGENNHDCEAITMVGNELWVFTKNRGDQQSYLYKLDKNRTKQKVSKQAVLPVSGLITGADYNPNTSMLVLVGYQKAKAFGNAFIWLVPVEKKMPVWDKARYYGLQPYGQWEGVVWESDDTILLTSEKSPIGAQQIGRIKIPR